MKIPDPRPGKLPSSKRKLKPREVRELAEKYEREGYPVMKKTVKKPPVKTIIKNSFNPNGYNH